MHAAGQVLMIQVLVTILIPTLFTWHRESKMRQQFLQERQVSVAHSRHA